MMFKFVCVCMCVSSTCESVDVFAGVVPVEAVFLSDVGHGDVKTLAVLI